MGNPIIYCEFGKIGEKGMISCCIVDDFCGRMRWCPTNGCVKNSEGYVDCRYRTEGMNKKKNIEADKVLLEAHDAPIVDEEIIVEIEDEYVKDYFPVLWKKDHAFAIDFYGYGISFHTSEDSFLDTSLINDVIQVKYKGNIGKPDFEILPIYE